jgi:acylphosphatase
MTRARVRVEGVVQGVCFRDETRARARSLGIAGWVRNRVDGSVEAVFEGDNEAVASMIAWCERGPAGARVENLDVGWEHPQGEAGFRIVV